MIVGLCGFAGAGKSTVANYLVDQYDFTRLSFAAALKDVCAALFHWDRARLEGRTPEDRAWREIPDEFWSKKMGQPWTPRYALQYVGTEVMRNNLHRNIWVDRIAVQLHALSPNARVVFDDARFSNELSTIESFDGTLLVLGRDTGNFTEEHRRLWNAAFDTTVPQPTTITTHLHPSETEWLIYPGIRTAPIVWNRDDFDTLYRNIDHWFASVALRSLS